MPFPRWLGPLVALIATSCASASADDPGWHHLRGPNLDGHSPETGLVDRWPEQGPPVLWTREIGQGYSGFVAHGDRVFTQTQNLGGQSVLCLNADTGETNWHHHYDWPYEPAGVYPGPRSTPTYHDGKLVFATPAGMIACLDAATGDRLWAADLKNKYHGRGTDFGYSISPTVFDGMVLVPVGGRGASLVALSMEDGRELWKSGDDPASYCAAYPISIEGRPVAICFMENTLAAYDPKTGEQLWSKFLSQGYDEHAAWPLYSEPYLMTCSPFRDGSKLYKLTMIPEPAIEEVRLSKLMANDVFSSVLSQGAVYGFDIKDIQAKTQRSSRGTFRCIDFLTGDQYWETDQVKHAAVLIADKKLILWTDVGELILARETTEKYDELARAQVLGGEIMWTQPILHRGRLYVRNQTRAVCVYLGEPETLTPSSDAPLLTVADISTEPFRDWTYLLAVEPEFAFDMPTPEWFRDWYLYSLAILGTAGAATVLLMLVIRRMTVIASWWCFWILSFVLGAVATTVLGQWRQEFTFTWQVCPFVMFQAWVTQSVWGNQKLVRHPRRYAYLAAVLFLATTAAYYLICKRLSLVFEWAFLCGFFPAIPFAWIGAHYTHSKWKLLTAVVVTGAAFSAFYWGSVAVLWGLY